MKDKKLLTPANFHDYIGVELELKSQVENVIKNVFNSYGYSRVNSPMLEYLDVFMDVGSIRTKDIFKFIDKDGEILALRSDMTPPIARIVAANFNKDKIPYRLSYIENIFQSTRNYQGKNKEFTQAGVELIGFDTIESDAEIISLAVNSLLEAGLEDFKINLGNVKFVKSILDNNICDKKIEKLQRKIIEGDFVALEKFINEENLNLEDKALLLNLHLFSGDLSVIAKVKKMTKNTKTLEALETLESLFELLKDYGVSNYINLDLSMVGHLNYYSGIIFEGYSKSVGYSILSGGRYNNLFKKFGVELPAVGFAIKINELLSAISKQRNIKKDNSNITLIMYDKEIRTIAIKTLKHLRMSGQIVELSLFGNDLMENKNYAIAKNLGGILYFKSNEEVDIINLLNNTTKTTNLSELMDGE